MLKTISTPQIFSSQNGTVSAPNNTPTTMFTAPNVVNGTWIVCAGLATNDPNSWAEVAIISTQQTGSKATTIVNGANIGITVSGLDVQVSQSSGAPQTVYWSATRIS